jgi:starvation-inducible DNA-binding protein
MKTTLTRIGLEEQKTAELTDKLNVLLANYQVFQMNVRGFHWNIKGEKFFELHAKFEELYEDLAVKIDEIAERILTLGASPWHTYERYLNASKVEVAENKSEGVGAVRSLLDAFQILIVLQRDLLDLSADANDEGTNAMMSDYIREQEKLTWMYSAYLNAS